MRSDLGLLNRVDEKELIRFLRDMIRVSSLSKNETELSELIAKKMESCGLSVQVIGGNVVGELKTVAEGPTLILNGHMDTVPVGDITSWTFDPFGAEIKDGRIYGRGASDMKGGLASMIMAIDALKKSGSEFNGNLKMTTVIMEELGEKLSQRKGIIELIDKGIICGDAAIVGEATNLNISLGHRGRTLLEVVVHGKSAHASMPEKGVNAIEKMATIITSLKKLKMGYHEILGKGTFNIGFIEGGTKANVVPDLCRVEIDRRLTLKEKPEMVEKDILKILEQISNKDKSFRAELRRLYECYPTLTSEAEAIVKILNKSIQKVTNGKPRTIVNRFNTDGGFISNLAKIPVVIFGPGNEELAHTADEYIEISQVIKATKIFALTILDFLKPLAS